MTTAIVPCCVRLVLGRRAEPVRAGRRARGRCSRSGEVSSEQNVHLARESGVIYIAPGTMRLSAMA